jgi:GntR family transcriptional regulator
MPGYLPEATCIIKLMPAAEGFPSRRIADDLRESIHSGQLAPGAEMLSENELAAEYHTSRKTARSALAILRSEGLITTGQGRRGIVRPSGQVGITVTGSNYRKHRSLGLPGFNAQALEQGQRPQQEIREVVRIPAPPEVAMRLDIDEGTEVIVRRLTFRLEGVPVALHDGYFPAGLAAGTVIEQPHLIRGGAHAVIEDPAGPIHKHIARSVDEISGRMPTPDEARTLRMPPGVPIFRILRTVYDSEGQPIEVQDSVAAGDRHTFCFEVDMR